MPLRPLVLAATLLGAQPAVQGGEAIVDPGEVARGIDVRLGEQAQGWSIGIEGTDPARTDVWLEPPDGAAFGRDLSLVGQTREERNRELAAALVLIIESHDSDARAQPRVDQPTEVAADENPPVRGWVAGFARVGMGAPEALDLDAGAELAGGVWLFSEVLQPVLEVGWSRSSVGELTVDGLRFGPGLAAGLPVARGRVWVGGLVSARALWGQARDARRTATWTSSSFVGPLLQVRWRWLLVAARIGVDATLPALQFLGEGSDLRWGRARFSASLGVGVVLGRGKAHKG